MEGSFSIKANPVEQVPGLSGTTNARINKALNGHCKHRTPSPALTAALTELEVLMQDVAETAVRIQWRSAAFERSALDDLDRLFGDFRSKHEAALETWADRGGAKARALAQAVRAFDRLLVAVLANNNLG